MISIPNLFLAASLLWDALCISLSFIAAFWIRFHSGWMAVDDGVYHLQSYLSFLAELLVVYLLVFKYWGLYRVRRGVSGADELSRIIQAAFVASVLVAATTFLAHTLLFSRLVIALTGILAILSTWVGRRLLRRFQIRLRRKGILFLTRLLIVGTGESSKSMIRRLRGNPGLGFIVVGVVAEGKGLREVEGIRVVGRLSEFRKIIARVEPNEVLFALPSKHLPKLEPLLVEIQGTPVKYRIVSDLFGLVTNPMEADELLGVPVFEMKEAPLNNGWNRFLKRTFDLVAGFPGFIVALPVMAFCAVGVKLTSPGPILFKQRRVGRDGKVFNIYKFRSMRIGSETAAFTRQNDPRRTAFGVFLRRTSLDELPQLYNVLQGRMSLVGPRPEIPALVAKFEKTVPRYFERHQVKSGITGWAQVHGLRGNTSLDERVKFDIYYIENWSLWLDVTILFRTVLDILEHRHAY
jgi:Undecaprenyl-phosphate glucose phosphotransferase